MKRLYPPMVATALQSVKAVFTLNFLREGVSFLFFFLGGGSCFMFCFVFVNFFCFVLFLIFLIALLFCFRLFFYGWDIFILMLQKLDKVLSI